jgi:hypothetical protein
LSLAMANPTSYQIFGLLFVMSARQISEFRIPVSISSMSTVVPWVFVYAVVFEVSILDCWN